MQSFIDIVRASTRIDDLDDAVRPIQEALGVTDGGHADGFFCHLDDDEWKEMSIDRRSELLRGYIDDELAYSL